MMNASSSSIDKVMSALQKAGLTDEMRALDQLANNIGRVIEERCGMETELTRVKAELEQVQSNQVELAKEFNKSGLMIRSYVRALKREGLHRYVITNMHCKYVDGAWQLNHIMYQDGDGDNE